MMWHIFGILLAVFVGLALVLYIFQNRLVYYPENGREITVTPRQAGLPYEDIQISTSDGVNLHGWHVIAPHSRGTVLFFHGNAGNISHRIGYLQMFYRLGYSVLIFDYRGYGNSGGATTEQGTYRDAEAAWRYLTEQQHIPSCRIVLFGESLGGAISTWLAARHPSAALVIASGFTSVPNLAHHFYPYFPVRWISRIHYDSEENLRAVATPVLISHSRDDEIIPFDHGLALFAAARQPKRFLEISGGHNDGFIFLRESWVKALESFFDEYVGASCIPPK